MDNIMDFYTSANAEYRDIESEIIHMAAEDGVLVKSIRFGRVKETYRGVIKSLDDEMYYLSFVPDTHFQIVKASSVEKIKECDRLYKSCTFGCDLIKAEGGSSGEVPGTGIMPVTEEENIENQDNLMTDVHPGGASGVVTPDRPEVGRQWHDKNPATQKSSQIWDFGFLTESLQNAGAILKNNVPRPWTPPDDNQVKFMREVLGKTDQEIMNKPPKLRPTEKVLYQQWASKNIKKALAPLDKWLNK